MTIDSALQTRMYLNRTKILRLLEKSVSTEDAEAVVGILAKAQNKAAKVNESHSWIMNLAYAAQFVSSEAELDALSKLGI